MAMVYVQIGDKNSDKLPGRGRIEKMIGELKKKGYEVFVDEPKGDKTSYDVAVTSKENNSVSLSSEVDLTARDLDLKFGLKQRFFKK